MSRQRREPGQSHSIDDSSGHSAADIRQLADIQTRSSRLNGHVHDQSYARTSSATAGRVDALYNTGFIESSVTAGPSNGFTPVGLEHMLPQPKVEDPILEDDAPASS